jgi:hypothetical protein
MKEYRRGDAFIFVEYTETLQEDRDGDVVTFSTVVVTD